MEEVQAKSKNQANHSNQPKRLVFFCNLQIF